MEKIDIAALPKEVDKSLKIFGWVDSIRDHGNIVFLDVRDRSGQVQCVVFAKELVAKAKSLSAEDLVSLEGKVQKRPEKLINPKLPTGTIEFAVDQIELISPSAPLPFEVNQNTSKIGEMIRLKYRYLDLRSERMRKNLELRSNVNHFTRNFFVEKGFWEVETPALTKGTPEGAREYVVPSRPQAGKFYVLPQSPQQYKQLLMVGGVEKYYQIVKCFRDEDQRGDRQPEFTQLDLEMSFVDQEDVINLLEDYIVQMVQALFPGKKFTTKPFPRITYNESIKKYQTDKPDLRKNPKDGAELAFTWVVDFPLFEYSETEKKVVAAHHPFTKPHQDDLELLKTKPLEVRANSYDLVLNGFELGSGSIRVFESDLQHKIFEVLGLSEEEIKARFGHMLEAFQFSPPPHGGFAVGMDRLIALLLEQVNIREVIAFPKTGDANDPLTGAPTELPNVVLKENHIKVDKK